MLQLQQHLLYLRCMQAPSEATNRLVTGCSPTVLGPEFHGQGGPPYMLPSLTDISVSQKISSLLLPYTDSNMPL